MMPAESFFIPLYFDEAEADLWSVLQAIEPEKRSGFIKAALRQTLLNEAEAAKIISQENRKFYHEGIKTDFPEDEPEDEIEESETFSLKDLFSDMPGLDSNPEAHSQTGYTEVKSSPQRGPWDYLLNSIIGVEEDEGVIAALQRSVHSEVQEEKTDTLIGETNQSEQKVYEAEEALEIAEDQTFDIESLQVDTPVPSSGFEHMMKLIIGTEEDEDILKALRKTKI